MSVGSITRRTALGAAAVGMAALGTTPAIAQRNARKTFVLVHSAWHGGWCWRRVADILERHGHKVYSQSLTGNGNRSHLLSKDVILNTDIADIVNFGAVGRPQRNLLSRALAGARCSAAYASGLG